MNCCDFTRSASCSLYTRVHCVIDRLRVFTHSQEIWKCKIAQDATFSIIFSRIWIWVKFCGWIINVAIHTNVSFNFWKCEDWHNPAIRNAIPLWNSITMNYSRVCYTAKKLNLLNCDASPWRNSNEFVVYGWLTSSLRAASDRFIVGRSIGSIIWSKWNAIGVQTSAAAMQQSKSTIKNKLWMHSWFSACNIK